MQASDTETNNQVKSKKASKKSKGISKKSKHDKSKKSKNRDRDDYVQSKKEQAASKYFEMEASDSDDDNGEYNPVNAKDAFYKREELESRNISMNKVIDNIEEKAKHREEILIRREQQKIKRHGPNADLDENEPVEEEQDLSDIIEDDDDEDID